MAGLDRRSGDSMNWMNQGACRSEDRELFFPHDELRGVARTRQIDAAKTVCNRCPVIDQCRAWALGSGQRYGIWGAMSQSERERYWRRNGGVTEYDETPDEDTIRRLVAGEKLPGASRIDVAHAAVRLIDEGWTFRAAGRELGVDGATIRQWAHRAWADEPLINPAWLERQRHNAEQRWVATAS